MLMVLTLGFGKNGYFTASCLFYSDIFQVLMWKKVSLFSLKDLILAKCCTAVDDILPSEFILSPQTDMVIFVTLLLANLTFHSL